MLREATFADFEICKALYEDDESDILYYNSCRRKEEQESVEEAIISQNYFFAEEDLVCFEEEMKLSREKFDKIILNTDERIYVFENEKQKIIACIYLYQLKGRRWKLVYLQISENRNIVLRRILKELIMQANITEIDVCTSIVEIQNILIENQYELIFANYFRKIRKTKKKNAK